MTINFLSYCDYIESLIKSYSSNLYSTGDISHEFKFKVIDEAGNIVKLNEVYQEYEDENQVIIAIHDLGIYRDTTNDINSFLQDIDVEFLCDENSITDLLFLINKISDDNRSSMITDIEDKAMILKIAVSHNSIKRSEIFSNETAFTKMNMKFIVYDGYYFSNDYTVKVNDIEIPFNNITINRTFETISDGKKTIDQKFFHNTSGQVVRITFPYLNNTSINRLVKDICKAGNFGETYNLVIIHTEETGDNALINTNYMLKTGTLTMAYGSIIALEVQFYPASTIL